MKTRRNFIKLSALSAVGLVTSSSCSSEIRFESIIKRQNAPLVISTWNHGVKANGAALDILLAEGSALDAVEAGVRIAESDPDVTSVGLGGFPDRDGNITLDACIMDYNSRCGAVAFLQNIENPISVARAVMEKTPHVMLVGNGAYEFARSQGFEHKELNTAKSKAAHQEWLKSSKYKPEVNIENHDTIGMIALDAHGNLAGACTTSGMAFKLHGRVGDSPIIGAGLFLDNDVGAACATGVGEAIIRVAGSAMVVEAMRYGKTPQEACEEVVKRIVEKENSVENLQVGFIAMNKHGEVGGYSIHPGFNFAQTSRSENELIDTEFVRKNESGK